MNLASKYLGLELKNPLIAAASPVTSTLDNIRRLEDNGAAAVVLPSIFEEEIDYDIEEADRLLHHTASEALDFLPPRIRETLGPQKYLDLIHKARAAVEIPIIASLNGISDTGWIQYAQDVQEAGANALELNVYFLPTDCSLTGAQVESRYIEMLKGVKENVTIPVAMKLSPFFSSPGNMVMTLDQAGANGFVLFNRFYQPDIDLAEMQLTRDLSLSTRNEIRLQLLWIGALAGKVKGSIAASSGVETADEVLKYILAGADVVMTASALLRKGVGHMATLVSGLEAALREREATSISQLRGKLSRAAVTDSTAFDRANYIHILKAVSAP